MAIELTKGNSKVKFLPLSVTTMVDEDTVVIIGSDGTSKGISYENLLTALGVSGIVRYVKEQITTASTIGTVSGTTYYYFCLTGDSYYLPVTADNNCVYNFKNDGSDVLYLLADSGEGDTIEVEERGIITIGTTLRVPPYESRCITAFDSTWRIF
tara:strand:- start:3080 stop:3544 length:465 start_codon:yes stop_codon:yes gene_type:complete